METPQAGAVENRTGLTAAEARRRALADGPNESRRKQAATLDSIAEAFSAVRELMELEAAGQGPSFDVDWRALQVSQTMRFLQHHLDSLRAGNATARQLRAASIVVQAARAARHSA